jgi:hypothetical protein
VVGATVVVVVTTDGCVVADWLELVPEPLQPATIRQAAAAAARRRVERERVMAAPQSSPERRPSFSSLCWKTSSPLW